MTKETDISTKVSDSVDPGDQIAPSFTQFNIANCLKVLKIGKTYINCFFRRFVTLTDGTNFI